MAYYGGRGDYYRGDYYRGDIWGGLRKVAGAVGKVVGAVTNPTGTAVSLLAGRGGSPPKPPSGSIYTTPGVGPIARGIRHLAGGDHRPKKGEPGYRGRRMNPLNVKALRRADRRAKSFLRITKSVVRHYTAKQPKGRAYVHASRKRK